MGNRMSKLRRQEGFTLIEVIVAIAVLAFGLLALATMQTTAIRGNFFASRTTEAGSWAQNKLEELMAESYDDLETCPGPESKEGGYRVTWVVNEDSPVPNSKLITVTVKWAEKAQSRQTQLICVKPNL